MTEDRPDETSDALAFAEAFEHAFQRVYLQFHRRDGKRTQMSAVSRSVLMHLAHTGPLTIGETATHLDRAQSVVSDIVTQLEAKGLLAREADPADRRRTLVWLTPAGLERLAQERRVLSVDLLRQAASGMSPDLRSALLDGIQGLLDAPVTPPATPLSTGHPDANGAPA